jgi:hypothetical protein
MTTQEMQAHAEAMERMVDKLSTQLLIALKTMNKIACMDGSGFTHVRMAMEALEQIKAVK